VFRLVRFDTSRSLASMTARTNSAFSSLVFIGMVAKVSSDDTHCFEEDMMIVLPSYFRRVPKALLVFLCLNFVGCDLSLDVDYDMVNLLIPVI